MIREPESILGSEDGAAYRRFLDWSLGAGFDLAIVKVALPVQRNALVAWTKVQVPEAQEINLAEVGPGKARLWELLDAAVRDRGASLLVLYGLEEAAARGRILAQLNVERDELVKTFALPWVLFVHPVVYPELLQKAPDFIDFAGLWLQEEGKVAPPLTVGMGHSEGSPTIAEDLSGKEDLLTQAALAIRLSHLDEARDLLARYGLAQAKASASDEDLDGALARCLRAFVDNRLEEALLVLREELLPAFERLGDGRAATMVHVADILRLRGELDEALRLLQDKVLPVFERLGDVRGRAVTLGKVADILTARGELDEALRIHRDEVLPVFERLGDVRSRAVTLGKVADILMARGELDEALRIHRDEELPVYERLGDVRARAVTLGKVADILMARGELDEALRIRREEELPVYERLGDVRSLLVGRTNLALTLLRRGKSDDMPEIVRLLALALQEARRLRLPEAQQIESIVRSMGLNPDAPPFG